MRWTVLLTLLCSASALASPVHVFNRRIRSGQTLGAALYALPISTSQVSDVVEALRGVLDFRTVRPGDQLRLVMRDGKVQDLDFRHDPFDQWQAHREGAQLVGHKRKVDIEKRVVSVRLSVDSSLYESALEAHEDPSIAVLLSDVFAWDIDFYQDVRKGDEVRALVEKYVSQGRFVRYGNVLAARYVGKSVGTHEAFRYQLPDGSASYYEADGKSAEKTFLKSPLKYARVTSGYGLRMHPVLHYTRWHRGVDYHAPIGTPVWAVANGTVVVRGRYGENGNIVCLRHPHGWKSCYCHLSRFGKGIHVGARVVQKQVIGYSGNTGLTTGPHLHYALKHDGHFVNPLTQHFPRAQAIPTASMADFRAKIGPLKTRLESQPVARAPGQSVTNAAGS